MDTEFQLMLKTCELLLGNRPLPCHHLQTVPVTVTVPIVAGQDEHGCGELIAELVELERCLRCGEYV